jgi:hypothetical protein
MRAARVLIFAVVLLSLMHVVTSCTPTTVTCSGDCCFASGASYTTSSTTQGTIVVNAYGDYWYCLYTITAPAGVSISIGHTRMNIDTSTVKIMNQADAVLFQTTGTNVGGSYLPGQVAKVEFSSSSLKANGGFTTLWMVNTVCLVACTSGQTDCDCNSGGSLCCNCVAGKCKTTSGTMTCTDCLAGQYSATLGATTNSCINCLAGKYSGTVGATIANTCINCLAGQYSATVGASAGPVLVLCTKIGCER